MTYLSSDNVTDLHEVVIHHICKVVRGEAIVLEDDLVINVLVIKDHLTVDDVLELGLTLGHLHPDDERFPIGLLLLDLLFGVVVQAEAIVLGLGVLLATDLDAHLLQTLCCAEARVGVTILQKSLNELVIDWYALALVVGAFWSVHFVTVSGLIEITLVLL